MRISPRTAVLFKALRRQLFDLLEARIANAPRNAGDDAPPTPTPHTGSDNGSYLAHTPRAAASKPPAPVQPGNPGWPPPLESREDAQEAILTSLVYVIGKGMELQADELAAAALAGVKKGAGRR